MSSDALDPGHLFGHVQDSTHFDVPRKMTSDGSGKIHIPQPLMRDEPIWQTTSPALQPILKPLELKITKFMILELVVAVIICFLFIGLANRMRKTEHSKGLLWNLLESMLLFIRDQVARPAIGHHDADRFLPVLWTLFFFVLGCNLLGMVPWAGSATGALATTAALAFVTFATVVGSGMARMGVAGFLKAQVPHMDLPGPLAFFLLPGIFVIEIFGLLIKHCVLAVRLLANMMAGHVVLAVILAFISASYGTMAWWGVWPASVLGATALSMLELFVAVLQAYVFTFLSALFIGAAVHPH